MSSTFHVKSQMETYLLCIDFTAMHHHALAKYEVILDSINLTREKCKLSKNGGVVKAGRKHPKSTNTPFYISTRLLHLITDSTAVGVRIGVELYK